MRSVRQAVRVITYLEQIGVVAPVIVRGKVSKVDCHGYVFSSVLFSGVRSPLACSSGVLAHLN